MNVLAFRYDWRKDLDETCEAARPAWLEKKLPGQPAHLIAYGMGGQAARAFVARCPEQWRGMWDGDPRAPADAAAG